MKPEARQEIFSDSGPGPEACAIFMGILTVVQQMA